MQSNKERSAEESYKKFLDIMLYDVPLNQLEELVVNDVTGYGTTLDEKILEIERLRKLIIDQREQGVGYEINFVVNPVHRRISTDNGLAVFIDEIEITLRINGNKNVIPLRFSSVLELINGSWKVVHLHGSVAVNTEGDTWHKEEHLRKIEELEKLVFEKTEDLVKKNRELEIETALEKVRSSALAMKEPSDMVEVCRIISDQLQMLGIGTIRNVQTAIINEQKSTYLNYQYFTLYNKSTIEEAEYNKHPKAREMAETMKRSANASYSQSFDGKDLDVFREYRKHDNQFPDPILDESTSLHFYFYSIGPGALGLSTYNFPLSENELNILKRFRNVFELAYRMFMDIQQAAAQARESQIELALERVRARTMGMQKSEELKEVIRVVYEQFVHLKINVDHAGFVVDYKPKGDWHFWIADERDIPSKITHPYFESVWANQFNEAKEKGLYIFTTNLNFEEKNKFYNKLLSYVPGLPQASKDFYLSCPGFAATTILMENVGLYIENFSGTPYSDEENATLMRFGKVFQQTYTRFLDLQKAEAQTREAQIELSLERIRAQVTAMRESSKLLDIVVTMRSEFVALGHEAHYFWHMRWLPDRYDKAMTSGDGTRIGMVMTLPRHIHGDVKLVADWEKSDVPTLVFAMDVDTAVEYVEKMISLGDFQQVDPQAPTLDDIRHIGGLTFIMARTTHGEIGFSLPGTVPNPPEESVTTLARFAGVFDLAYRRFEDLREAEEKNKIIQAENDRKTKELEEARELQISLLPTELPKLPGMEIAAFMRTATEVGGDYYDFIVQKNDVLNVALGDATGHGLQAGTMVTLMKGLFTSQSSHLGPKEFMSHCAQVIKDIKLGRILMSFIYLRFENSRLLASSAGMPPIYYHHKSNNRTEEIVIQGMPLGAMRNLSYNLVEKKLCSGDTILLLTDGLPEQMNDHNVPFDYSRVRKYFSEIAENTPDDIIKGLVKKADEWMDGTAQADDITFVVIKVK